MAGRGVFLSPLRLRWMQVGYQWISSSPRATRVPHLAFEATSQVGDGTTGTLMRFDSLAPEIVLISQPEKTYVVGNGIGTRRVACERVQFWLEVEQSGGLPERWRNPISSMEGMGVGKGS